MKRYRQEAAKLARLQDTAPDPEARTIIIEDALSQAYAAGRQDAVKEMRATPLYKQRYRELTNREIVEEIAGRIVAKTNRLLRA